jgi:hypothetical protein
MSAPFIVVYTLRRSDKFSDHYEVFDDEADALWRYEEVLKDADLHVASIAQPIKSTDYECISIKQQQENA